MRSRWYKKTVAMLVVLALLTTASGFTVVASEADSGNANIISTAQGEETSGGVQTDADENVTEETAPEVIPSEENTPSEDATSSEGAGEEETRQARDSSILRYSAHVQSIGWQAEVRDGTIAGTIGRSKRIEALKINVTNPSMGGVEYRAHVQGIGWQNWVSGNAVAGTTGQSKRVEAMQIRLTGQLAEKYDIYYRVHSAYVGWLGWAKNSEIAGTSGYGYAAEAFQISVVKKGGAAPGSTADHYRPSPYEITFRQIDETTKVSVGSEDLKRLISEKQVTSLRITAQMEYNGAVTRKISSEKKIADIAKSGLVMDIGNYGKFKVTVEFKKDSKVVKTTSQNVGIVASEYNIAPVSATLPVVFFSLSLWDIRENENGVVPTIAMLSRPSAYNWEKLPSGVYAMPYLSSEAIKTKTDYAAFQQYVKDLYELNPSSKFNLYINDIDCSYIHKVIYANRIPEGQYSITLMSDGSATYNFFNQTYGGTDAQSKHNSMIANWKAAKKEAYATGKASSNWEAWHSNMDYSYAALECEPGTQWWVARNNLFSSKENAFAEQVKQKVTVKNIGNMLKELQNKGAQTVNEFKNLYDFNDGYFEAAQKQGKKAMMLLGTYVYNEKDFKDYAQLTELYYGDEYLYYYKGHPNTPTGLYPSKQAELAELEITDIDSSIAAELILFFNPDIALSGYGTSTFNSASAKMACGLYNTTKQAALSGTGVDYSGIDWFASRIDLGSAEQGIANLCEKGSVSYLLEFSEEILKAGQYSIAIYDETKGNLKYYKLDNGQYSLVKTVNENGGVSYRAHVAREGWQKHVKEGKTAGTIGESKAVEALEIRLNSLPYKGNVTYRAHVAKEGWQGWVRDEQMAGTEGKGHQMEAIQIKLEGEVAKHYDIYYRAHSQSYGWLGWAKNGEVAGTESYGKRMEAIQVRLVEKGGKAPGSTENPVRKPKVEYKTHVQTYGWQPYVRDGVLAGTEGLSKRLEAIRIQNVDLSNAGSVEYKTHVQTHGWEKSWKADGAMSGTSGQGKRLEAIRIRLSGDLQKKYDVYYRVHVQSYGWLDWTRNGEMAGSEGRSKRMESIQIQYVEKGGKAPGDTKRPFVK